ncbi:carbohydrate kinase family protein [Phototrophicus methaneseepsis]|uniref:Carbohydrate kinase family protein n=1 Tax=Phototrophicus methaneseepsis TaxID=2710758 RepID=A0A7S8EC67_9CHLR|nr:carbohydrate kinase family protein [Phototrophicus methaneseepsis]QPC84038.1 carbohydrate kinase family protein [Phototrophicus methaneseepsis]
MVYDALVYGPLFCDLIFTDLPDMPVLGEEIFAGDMKITVGGSAIVAAALHRLGAKVGLIADLGNDQMSTVVQHLLEDMGLDTSLIRHHDYALPQLTVALSFPHDRAFVTRFEKPRDPLDLGAVLAANPARHLHVCSFMAAFDTPEAPHIAHEHNMSVSLDLGWDSEGLRDPKLRAMIAEVDMFMPSRSELCHVMGTTDKQAALDATISLMGEDAVVIMKDGKHGALARTHSETITVPAVPVTPVDTTGAGDSFDAGFIYGHTQGFSLETSLQYGSICGALATTAPGGATATPTQEEVQQWLLKLQS